MKSNDKFVLTSVGTVELDDELVEASQYRNFVFTLYTVHTVKELKCSNKKFSINKLYKLYKLPEEK